MDKAILDKLIQCYETDMDELYGGEHDEIFKWRALKTFQAEWFRADHPDFLSKFNAATRDFSVLIDNSRMHPRSGVVKLWEKNPDEVERLFCEVLFAADHGDLTLRQEHMDAFVDGMEQLRVAHYPANWSFKQDRHTASAFLAMYAPEDNYIYKSSEANLMENYGAYGFHIGSGEHFDLSAYYRMCDEIAASFREHSALLEKHFDKIRERDDLMEDHSLHILVYDLIYCSKTYNYYNRIHLQKRKPEKQAKAAARQEADEVKRQAQIEALTTQIEALYEALPDVSDISLTNVEVTSRLYGTGMVIEHDLNTIRVQFPGAVKSFILNTKYNQRPSFENDAEVVAAYTEYTSIMDRIHTLERQLLLLAVK